MAIDTSFLFKQPGSSQPEKRAAAIQDATEERDQQIMTGTSTGVDTSFLFKTAPRAAIPADAVAEQPAPAEEESMWKGVGTSISEGFKRLIPQAKILATQQIWSPVLPQSLLDKLTEKERKEIKESEQREAAAQPTRELSMLEKGARGAVVSGTQMLPGVALSVLTKNPSFALSSAGVQTGLDSYGAAVSAGKSHNDALKYASVDAAIEVATEKIPTGRLLDIFGSNKLTDFRKQLISYALAEVPGEQVATFGQSLNAYVNGLDNELAAAKTDADRLKIQAERQAVTAISTVLTSGALGGAGLAAQKLAGKPEEPVAPPAPPTPPPAAPPPASTIDQAATTVSAPEPKRFSVSDITTAEAQPTPVAPVGEPAATAETTTVSQPSTTVASDAQAAAPAVEPVGTAVAPSITDQGVAAPAPAVAAAPVTTAPAELQGAGVISTADLKQQLAEVDAEAAARAAEQAIAAPQLPEGLTAETSVTETFGPDDTRFAAFESATDKELYVLGKLNRRPAKTPELTETARQLTSKVAQSLGIPPEEVAQRAEATRVATQNGLSGVQAGAVYRVPTGITTPPVSPLMQLASDQIGEKFSLPEGEKVVIPEAPVDPVRTKIASVIKDAFGVDVVWASLPKGGKVKTNKGRELVAINGARIAGTNAILLDANNYSFLNTLGHELTHVLETQYPQLYQQLVALAKTKVSKKFQNQLRKEVANDAEFNSELVAEMVGEQSTDPAFWQEVFNSAGDQASAQGFLDALNRIIDRILNALQGYQPMVVQSRKDALAVRQAAQQAFQQWITARQQAAQQVAADQQAAVQAAAAATRVAPVVNPFLVGTSLDPNAPKPAELGPPKVPPSRQAQVNIGQKGRRFVTFASDLDKDLFELGAKLKKAAKTLSKADREAADARLVRFMAITGLPRAEMYDVAKNYRDAVVKAAGAVQEDGTYEAPATNIGERRAVEERKVEERGQPQRQRADEQVRKVRQDREQPPVEQGQGAEAGGRDRAAEGRPQPQEEVAAEEEVIRDLPQFSRKRPAVDPEFAEQVADDVGLTSEQAEATSLKYQTGKSGEDQFNTPAVGGLTNTVLEIERARREGTLGQLDLESEADRSTVAKMLAAEVVAAVRAGGGAKEWYDKTIRRTLAMASLKFPELATDKEAQTAFRLSVAITSQGLNVEDNLKFAMQVYGEYRKNGTFPLKGQGKNGGAMVSNFQLANSLMEKMGKERFSRFLETEFIASELNAIGFNIDELADEKILGSSVFGPKIGFGFYSNLSGNFEPVTIDMWFMRTIGRLIGKLRAFDAKLFASQRDKFRASFAVEGVNGIFINSRNMSGSRLFSADLVQNAATDDDAAVTLARLVTRAHERDFKVNRTAYDNKTRVKSSLVNNAANMLKSLDKPKDAPSSGSERRNLRDIVRQTVSIVEGVVGERIPPASMQALVWYPEQELYKSFGVKLRVTSQDYAGAIRKILEKEGYSGRELSAAAESGSRRAQPVAVEPVEAEDVGAVREAERLAAEERAGRQLTTRERDRLLVSEVIKRYRQSSAAAQGSYKIRSAGDGRRIRVLGNDAKAEYKPVITFRNALGAVGKPAPTMYELDGGAALFRQAIQDSKNAGKFGAAVYVYDEADYANMRLFISEDGKSGFALKGNDIVSVFSGQKGSANAMLQLAVDQGGQRLDAFDTVLPELYADNGFKVVARVKWNDEYSPEGWDKATFAKYNNGEPDVVFMVYDPANASELGGKVIENYDDGVAAQQEAIGVPAEDPSAADQTILFSRRRKPDPENTVVAYKLFRIKKSKPGQLFPLYVNANEEVPVGVWLDADMGAQAGVTKTGRPQVKSKIGPLAQRPGWHAGDLPIATHIGGGRQLRLDPESGMRKQLPTFRREDEVWAEVEISADRDWQTEANKRATVDRDGIVIPSTAQITDQVPEDGYYRYKTNPNMTGNWIIGGSMKVNRILTDDEVTDINEAANVADLPREKPLDLQAYGFVDGEPIRFSRVRSETNADGKQIASTPEFIQNFWNWFGDSKLVDRRGRPKVMYHGTIPPVVGAEEFIDQGISVFRRGTGGAIFVSPDERVANTYAGPGGSVYPLYVRAENPFDFENPDHVKRVMDIWESNNVGIRETREQAIAKGKWQMIENVEIQDAIKLAGFDSYYVKETGAKNLALYDPSQLKSAVGNVGAFSPERPEIQFSRVRQGRKYWLPEFGRLQRLLRGVQNEVLATARAQKAVAAQGGVLTESTEIESAMHRMYGRAGNRLDRFRKDVVEPILKRAADNNVDLGDVELYLYANHAKEANRRIASINPQMPDGGSGMTNAEADQVMATLRQDMAQFVRIKSIADEIQNITKMTQTALVNGDIVSPADVAAWNATYNYYVPLKTFEQADDLGRVTGNGRFDLANAFSKRRLGRKSKAGAIVENILADYEEAVVAVERNNVRKAWLQFILANKDSELWQVNKPVMQRAFYKNPVEEVRYRLTIQKDAETLPVRVGGDVYHMVIKDPEILEELQMTSVLSQFPDTIKSILGGMNTFGRSLSKLWTVLSPPFVLINAARDVQTSLINTGIEQGLWSSAKLLATLPKAAYTVWRAERNNAWTGSLKQYYDMYRADGGKTGALDLRQIEDRHSELMSMYRNAQASIGKPLTYHRLTMRYLKGIEDFMMDINGAIEGAARVAAYKVAMENGKSRIEATNIAKEITVNFNRRGKWTPVLSGMYLFFNPAVQGAKRTLSAVFSKRGAAVGTGLIALGYFVAEMAASAVGDDDEPYWEKPSMRQTKLKNLVFFGQNGETYNVPLPYGFGFFVNLGYALRDLKNGVDPFKVGAFMRDSASLHFSPLGSMDNMATFLSPTLIDPAMVLITGEKETGLPLMPEDFTGVTPDSERYWNNTRDTMFQNVTAWLYEATGGGTGGKMAIDVSPESVEYVTSFLTGGAGTFVKDVIKTFDAMANTGTASATEQNLIPVLKAVHRQPDGRYDSSAFYENAKEAKEAARDFNAIMESESEVSEEKLAYADSIAGMAALSRFADKQKRAISTLRQQDLDIQQDETLTREEKYGLRKEIAEQIRQAQVDFNIAFYAERRAISEAEKAQGQAEE